MEAIYLLIFWHISIFPAIINFDCEGGGGIGGGGGIRNSDCQPSIDAVHYRSVNCMQQNQQMCFRNQAHAYALWPLSFKNIKNGRPNMREVRIHVHSLAVTCTRIIYHDKEMVGVREREG